ncbi:hypothetical protein [Caulobacter soli]|uniref:hypothetical protein n=1 Tax=Caulobacter soli TaxID=2708539 RepID=UPI0013EAAFAD|nr:hypothetical protein [Caulobacter soli]
MAADGVWNITVNSPMGAQKSVVTLAANGETLTGTAVGQAGTQNITDGKVSGGDVSWKVAVTTPFPMTLEFVGAVDGDKIAGQVKAGNFGSFPFSGERA